MNDLEYKDLCSRVESVELVRPFWEHEGYHENMWRDKDVTVLICQRKTEKETRLCVESLLSFYPDIPILVVDGNSMDDSTLYLKTKASLYKNVSVWERVGRNSHGETMDEAIREHIKTRYVLLMDSDTITVRGGWLEDMLNQFSVDDRLYAIGTLMLVTKEGEACGVPKDNDDVLRYAHPSLSLYDTYIYKQLSSFVDHGAACCHNNADAELHDYTIKYYPIDKYVAHLSGASWCVPKTIWQHDLNVISRPLVTFIMHSENCVIKTQDYNDFDIIIVGNECDENVVIHNKDPFSVKNKTYNVRFNVFGEYVCELSDNDIPSDFVRKVAEEAIKDQSDILNVLGLTLIKRKLWQRTTALKS